MVLSVTCRGSVTAKDTDFICGDSVFSLSGQYGDEDLFVHTRQLTTC